MEKRTKDIVEIVEKLKKNKNVIVIGPDGNEENPGKKLRVYSNGGCIGKIPTEDSRKSAHCELVSKGKMGKVDKYPYPYAKYLRESFVDGHGKLNKNEIKSVEKMKELYPEECQPMTSLEDFFVTRYCKAAPEEKDEIIASDAYLDLVNMATKNKMKNEDELSERNIQTRIAKKQIDALPGQQLLVTDVEFCMDLTDKRPKLIRATEEKRKKHGKADFVVFDGKSIGLVELKYNAKSMEIGSANSLYEHMLDFYDIIHWNGKRCLTECIRRMKMMCDYEVIDESWKNLIETFEKKVAKGTAEQYLWCGFVFAGNEQDEHIVLDAVKSQLFTEPSTQKGSREICLNLDSRNYDNIDVRYQYIVVDTSKNEKEDMIFEDMILKEKIKERIEKENKIQ